MDEILFQFFRIKMGCIRAVPVGLCLQVGFRLEHQHLQRGVNVEETSTLLCFQHNGCTAICPIAEPGYKYIYGTTNYVVSCTERFSVSNSASTVELL